MEAIKEMKDEKLRCTEEEFARNLKLTKEKQMNREVTILYFFAQYNLQWLEHGQIET
jgi:hypothetical protein